MSRKIYPSPEAILPDVWRIEDGAPRVDLKARHMWLNLQDDPQWANVRAHELAHVAFTPELSRAPKGISEDVIQAVEDYRINTLAAKHGVDFSAGAPTNVITGVAMATEGNDRAATLLLLAAFDDADRERVDAALAKVNGEDSDLMARARELCYDARAMMYARGRKTRPFSWRRTVDVARWLDEQLRTPQPKAHGDLPTYQYDEVANGKAGEMAIEMPLLSGRGIHHAIRTADEGCILRAPWRVTTDMRVFREITAPKTGSVLIDGSGSMHLGPEDVRRIVETVPAGVVAAYSAPSDLSRGILRVLGRRGRVADPKSPAYRFGGGNVVDVPALDWLAHQPAPRVWVCDGVVTGIGDKVSKEVNRACADIARAAAITRVDDVNGALKLLQRKRR